VTVGAATLQLAPASGTYAVGSMVSVSVSVRSSDQAFNAVSGTLKFSSDTLEVVSLSKSGSVVSLWVQEPSYSNAAGSVSFEGIVLNPGYKGASGKVLTVQFRVKKAGSGSVNFSSGEVLANDGVGTSILSGLSSATYNLTAVTVTEESPKTEPRTKPVGSSAVDNSGAEQKSVPVTVSSQTHPADSWSKVSTADFLFSYSTNVLAVRLLVDDKADSIPTVLYSTPPSARTVEDLAEGVSYLHVQAKTVTGWGEVLHYILKVDTKNPTEPTVFELKEEGEGEKRFAFSSSDTGSGLAHFEVQLNGDEPVVVEAGSPITQYSLSDLKPGDYTLLVRSVDLAGNTAESTMYFVVPETSAKLFPAMFSYASILGLLLSTFLISAAYLFAKLRGVSVVKEMGISADEDIQKNAQKASATKTVLQLRDNFRKDIAMLKRATRTRSLSKLESKILRREAAYVELADEFIEKSLVQMSEEVDSYKKSNKK
jgi:hypothetical protein